MRRAHAVWPVLGLSALAILIAGCAKTTEVPATAVVVAIEAEPMVRASIDSLHVEIASGPSRDELEIRATERFDLSDGARWPITLTLLPKTKGTDAFRIWARARKGGRDVSELRVISGFAKEQVLLLEVLLPDECIGVLDCNDEETCMVNEDGATLCGDADVPVASLVPFTRRQINRLLDAGTLDPESDGGAGDSGAQNGDGGEPNPDGGDEPVPDGGGNPMGRERCDNGDDDDDDGDIDCADEDCEDGFVCLPEGDELAVVMTDVTESCPSGYEDIGVVSNDLLTSDRCSGCGCSTEQAEGCEAPVYFYASLNECQAMGSGTYVGAASNGACGDPIGPEEDVASPFGWRVGNIAPVTPARCDADGEPELPEPRWRRSRKLCRGPSTGSLGGGCGAGSVCAPRVESDSGSQCALLPAGDACPSGDGDDWYEGFKDERRCGNCSCSLEGGSCDGATTRLGSDYVCDVNFPHLLGENSHECFGGSSIYYPPADVLDGPTAASCTALSNTVGSIDLLGGHRICCP